MLPLFRSVSTNQSFIKMLVELQCSTMRQNQEKEKKSKNLILAFEGSSTATTSCPKNYTILACAEQTLHLATLKQAIKPSKSVSFLWMTRWSSMELLSFLPQRTSGVGWPVMRIRQSMARFSRVIRGPPWLLSMHGAARRKQNVIMY